MLGALVGEEKVYVEAEKTPTGVVLSLRDVRLRRKLTQQVGKHNAKMGTTELRALGFPDQFFKDLERGRPVQFKMYYSAFSKLVGGSARLDGLSQPEDWECEVCEGEVLPRGEPRRGIQRGRCLQCGRGQEIDIVESARDTDPPVYPHDPFMEDIE